MREPILQSSLLRPEDVVVDFERDGDSDRALHEVLKVIESGDKILVELAEDLGVQFNYDGSVLTTVQRRAISKKCLARPGYDTFYAALRVVRDVIESNDEMLLDVAADLGIESGFYDGSVLTPEDRQALLNKCLTSLGYDGFDTALCEIRKEAGKPSDGLMTQEEMDAVGIQVDYNGSRLTPEQRRVLFKSYWARDLKMIGLRSPQYYAQYYGGKSKCPSVLETAWPGTVTYLHAEKLKRGFIEPEELIKRLGKLKPTDNFELRKFRHPRMEWRSPTPLHEEGFEILPPDPDWMMDQIYGVNRMERRLGRKFIVQNRREMRDRWAAVESGVELTPLPDSHLLRDMGRSPGGTLFPWYLVKGLMTLRKHANDQGDKSYGEEYDSAKVKREEAIHRWRERNPDSTLADDLLSIYKTWPADLIAELDEVAREAIRCGRRKYVALLRETEPKMQALVTFWTDCGLVTGQRTPPSCWWQDPKAKAEQLPKPQYLQERLNAINTEFTYDSDKAEKLRMIETSRWMESIINGDSEPTAPDTPLPQSLLDELDIVWRGRHWLDGDDTEDEMIAKLRRWRESKPQQCVQEGIHTSQQLGMDTSPALPVQTAGSPVYFGQMNLSREISSGAVVAPEETRQLQETRSRGACRQLRMNPTAEDRAIWRGRLRPRTRTEAQTTWRDRLRPRSDTVSALHNRTKATNTQTGKPQGIVKRRKALEKRPAATKSQANSSNTQKADPSHPGIQSPFNESASQAVPTGSVTKARGTTLRRRPPRQASAAQPQGVRKTRNGNRRQTHRPMGAVLTTNRKQGLLRLLTPPQSE